MTSTSQASRLPRATPRPFCASGEFGMRVLPTAEAVSSLSSGCLRLVHGISGQRPRIEPSPAAHPQGDPSGARPGRDGRDRSHGVPVRRAVPRTLAAAGRLGSRRPLEHGAHSQYVPFVLGRGRYSARNDVRCPPDGAVPVVRPVRARVHRPEDLAGVGRLRACNADGSVVRLAPAVGGRCVEGAGASPVAVARRELLDLQLPLRFGHRALGANGGRRPRCFLSPVDQLAYPDVRNRRRTLLASADNAEREHLTLFQVSLGTVRHEGFLMPRPKPMKTMGPTGRDPPIEVVHFADPWCWWSWGLEPILQRLREVYADNVQVTYKMGGEFETLKAWMEENGVDERGTVDWILESVSLTHMPVQPP